MPDMPNLINPQSGEYQLGMATMDATHQQFIHLVNELFNTENSDKERFSQLFDQLFHHTKDHFTAENSLMLWRSIKLTHPSLIKLTHPLTALTAN